MIAALFVETGGAYYGLEGVDPWDIGRDARNYNGPWPVIAHPPCNVWCQLAYLNQSRLGYPVGDDGGCFAAALEAVRRWGGVLEHPAHSIAWTVFDLPEPAPGGWVRGLFDTGWATEISQCAYGHRARKRTWLYYVGATPPAATPHVSTRGARHPTGVSGRADRVGRFGVCYGQRSNVNAPTGCCAVGA